MAQPKANEL